VFCIKCGHSNPESGIFCARCGERLDKSEPQGETTVSLPVLEEENEESIEFTTPPEPLEKGSAMLALNSPRRRSPWKRAAPCWLSRKVQTLE